MKKSLRQFTLLSILISLIFCPFTGCGRQTSDEEYAVSEENKLIIYTAHKEEIYAPIIREFEERSGIWVQIVSGGTNELLERIKNENGNPGADVMFGGGVDSLRAYEEFFLPYETAQKSHLDSTYASANHSYTVFSKLPIVFVYNTKLVLLSGAPRSFAQLSDYQWKNNIAFADPNTSGSSYTVLSTMIFLEENPKGYDTIRSFSENIGPDLSAGSNKVVSDVSSGNKLIGITLEETALKEMAKSPDISMIYPKEGTCAVPDGAAIINGCTHLTNAQKFMEFIVSDDVQHLLEDQLYRRSVRLDFSSSDVPGEKPYDMDYSAKHRDEILNTWNESREGMQ